MVAAVPEYVGNSFAEAPPGHRFRLYFDGWWTREVEERRLKDAGSPGKRRACEARLRQRTDFGVLDEIDLLKNLQGMGALSRLAREVLEAWRARQERLTWPDDLVVEATGATPFVTGMGLEHPIENGFAFLDPYGLPYLPGSSVKGVVRKAAEELALFGEDGEPRWHLDDVWCLFGFDGQSAFLRDGAWQAEYARAVAALSEARLARLDRIFSGMDEWKTDRIRFLRELPGPDASRLALGRGDLSFWDVVPVPPSPSMRVDVMTPHFSAYYNGRLPPSDDQDPKPIQFLALPAKTRFRFHVRHDPSRAGGTACPWRKLMDQAFQHAFTRLGFGAKTSAGYGRMEMDEAAGRMRERARAAEADAEKQRAEERRRALMSPLELLVERLATALASGSENEVHEVYRALPTVGEEDRVVLARELKQAFVRLGKWDGVKKKQKDKVDAIKQILGER
jgi:CRISPR-associated protein Cmr6